MNKRQDRANIAAALAPTAPPCFSSRDQWVEYVVAAAVDQREEHLPQPLRMVAGKPVDFNPRFGFCIDCDDSHAARMARVGKCNPRHLIELHEAQQAKESA